MDKQLLLFKRKQPATYRIAVQYGIIKALASYSCMGAVHPDHILYYSLQKERKKERKVSHSVTGSGAFGPVGTVVSAGKKDPILTVLACSLAPIRTGLKKIGTYGSIVSAVFVPCLDRCRRMIPLKKFACVCTYSYVSPCVSSAGELKRTLLKELPRYYTYLPM